MLVSRVEDAIARIEDPDILRRCTRKEMLARAPEIAHSLATGLPAVQLENIMPHLATPWGQLYQTTIVGELISGRLQVGDLAQLQVCELENPIDPRVRVQGMFFNALRVHNDGLPKDRQCGGERIVELASLLEHGLYNKVIHSCSELGDSILRSWDNPSFLSHYSARADTVYRQLDPGSPIVKTHGDELAVKLLTGVMDPILVGSMSASDLCPAGFETERQAIDLRKEQKVEKKVTTLWTCPGCKGRASTTRAVQDRGPDEPTSIYATCTICHLEWKAA